MYYTGVDPRTMQPVYVPKNPLKSNAESSVQYRDPKNYDLVMEALKKAHRMDLVGFDKTLSDTPEKIRRQITAESTGTENAESEVFRKTGTE